MVVPPRRRESPHSRRGGSHSRSKPPQRTARGCKMLADRALDDDSGDRLDFDVRRRLAGLIDNPETGTPLTIAIHGPWGAGKSTFAG